MTNLRTLLLTATVTSLGVPHSARAQVLLVPQPSRVVREMRAGGSAFQIASSILKETRHIDITVPASYRETPASRRYPVTIVLDGETYLAPAAMVSGELARNGLIPEMIIVAIENEDPYRGRVHDLTPPGVSVSGSTLSEGGDRFLDFIEKELLPAVDRQFRGGLPRTLVGHSNGAILATYAAATRPGFRTIVAIDAPVNLGDQWLPKKLLAATRTRTSPLRFAYYDARFPWPDTDWNALRAAAPASWQLSRESLHREGHETAFMLGAYLGLREVFNDYSRIAAPQYPTTKILPYYANVRAQLGADVVPPKRTIRDVVENALMEGRGRLAREAYDLLVTSYGAPADASKLTKEIAVVERLPPPTESVEALLATPMPTAAQAQRFVGDWIGDTWQSHEEPHNGKTTLRIRVLNGRAIADLLAPDAPEELRVRRADYFSITPNGLTFGFMNGMRPYGVFLWEGRISGDTLSGKGRFGGINFRPMEGMPLPDPGFRFVRSVAK